MKAGTLATVAQVKGWLNISGTADDALLQRLVDGASAFVYSYLSLDTFAKSQYDETYDGTGGAMVILRQMPSVEVLAVSINGSPLAPAAGDGKTTPFTNGFRLIRQNLTLFGLVFPYCRNAVYVSYTAGYERKEAHTVPDVPSVTVDYTWLADEGVTLANGTPLSLDTTGELNGPNQYTVEDGEYTFSDDVAEAIVTIAYSYVPADINQAVIELVAERYKYRDRIGHSSKSLGGQETVAFQANNVPQFIIALLNKYIRVVPA